MANSALFDEAEFQAHLVLGSKIMQGHISKGADVVGQEFATMIVRNLDQSFAQGFKLKTGLSMEQLWVTFRPILVPDQMSMSRILQIIDLGNRFDQLRWKTASSLPSLSKALSTLQQSFEIAR